VQFELYDHVAWSALFTIMEEAKRMFDLQDYSISQPTLEQVRAASFIIFKSWVLLAFCVVP
jgi:hypothetical protein